MRKRLKKLWWKIAAVGLALVALVAGSNYWVVHSTDSAVFSDIKALPTNNVGLVLGTGQLLRSGRANPHFRARVEAAAELYHVGKVKHLLLSGDNHVKTYDEPNDMKQALLTLDVPESAMTLDYAGFRTLDSVVRARKVFGQSKFTIITDDFHANRAVFLAQHFGENAVAFCSSKVPVSFSARSRVREVAARVKAVLDVYVLHTQPKFLGDPVEVKIVSR